MDVADICAALEKGMTEITLEGVTGDEITWTEDGEPNKAPKSVLFILPKVNLSLTH